MKKELNKITLLSTFLSSVVLLGENNSNQSFKSTEDKDEKSLIIIIDNLSDSSTLNFDYTKEITQKKNTDKKLIEWNLTSKKDDNSKNLTNIKKIQIPIRKKEINFSYDKSSETIKNDTQIFEPYNVKTKFNRVKSEKILKNMNIELTQLMEQGDQVIKSPFSSSQFGFNYTYNRQGKTYRGRGDKVKEIKISRSNNYFERYIMPPGGNSTSILPININERGTRNTLNIMTPNIREITNSSDTNRGFVDTKRRSAPSYLAQDLNISPNDSVNMSYTNQDFIDKKTRNVFFVDDSNKTAGNLSLGSVDITLKNGNGATIFYANNGDTKIDSGSINMTWDDRSDKYKSGSSDIVINATSKVENKADINITNAYNTTAITLRGDQGYTDNSGKSKKLSPAPNPNQITVDVTSSFYGAKGDGRTDDTAAIQKAIDDVSAAGGGTVIIPSGTYLIDGTATQPTQGKWGGNIFGLMVKSNVNVIMNDDTIMQAMNNSEQGYSIFTVRHAENVNISGGVLIGNRHAVDDDNNYGEWGAGVNIAVGKNVTVENVIAQNFRGDGFIIQDYGDAAYSENIILNNVVGDNNLRQGLSIIDGKSITVLNSTFKNTNGIHPGAGIDVEPEAGNSVEGLEIAYSEILNNYNGGILFYGEIGNNENISKINFHHNFISGNQRGGIYADALEDSIIRENTIEFNDPYALYLTSNSNGNLVSGNSLTMPGANISNYGNNTITNDNIIGGTGSNAINLTTVLSEVQNYGNINISGEKIFALNATATSIYNYGNLVFKEIRFDEEEGHPDNTGTNRINNTLGSSSVAIGAYAGGTVMQLGHADISVTGHGSRGITSEGYKNREQKYVSNVIVSSSDPNNPSVITATDGAYNTYASEGLIQLNNVILNTGQNSVAFFPDYFWFNNYGKRETGNRVINNQTMHGYYNLKNVTVNVGSEGAVFYVQHDDSDRGYLSSAYNLSRLRLYNLPDMKSYLGNFIGDSLKNLTLNMEKDSIMFVVPHRIVSLKNMAQVTDSLINAGATIIGDDYKRLLINEGQLDIDQPVNLDNSKDEIYRVYTVDTAINNNNVITGTQDGQIGIVTGYTNHKNRIVLRPGDLAVSEGIEIDKLRPIATATNNGNIHLSGKDSVGMYTKTGVQKNEKEKIITMDGEYSTAMYGDDSEIINDGIINLKGRNSIGIYGTGEETVITNNGIININSDNTTGIYLDNGAKGYNNGTIQTGTSGLRNVYGVYVANGSELTNNGVIKIEASGGKGAYLKGGTFKNYGFILVTGVNSKEIFDSNTEIEIVEPYYSELTSFPSSTIDSNTVGGLKIDTTSGTATIFRNGEPVSDVEHREYWTNMTDAPKTVPVDSIGMYIDTSGISYTKPISNVGLLTDKADLIIGPEATEYTNKKDIIITDSNIIGPYRASMIANPQVTSWRMYSGSMTWLGTGVLDTNSYLSNIVLAKVPYTNWAGKEKMPVNIKNGYNFLEGLEQRYGVDWYGDRGAREKEMFNKLNSIGNNEEALFYQAIDEMTGKQYANIQQRTVEISDKLDKEINHLRDDWSNPSKDSNKVEIFGTKSQYKTNTHGIVDYDSQSHGIAYVHEDETIKLGNSIGWYAGYIHNRNKFKDIGKSKEDTNMIKAGIFKNTSFDDNGSLKWTISGGVYVAQNNMHRKFFVVDDVFNAKSKYYTYGADVKNELSKEFRVSEKMKLKLFSALDIGYGRFSKIKENKGEARLEVKGNDYYSIKPEIGLKVKYERSFAKKSKFTIGVGATYETELGKVNDVGNEAKVRHTATNTFKIRGEKENRRGNGKFDFNIGIDNTKFGISVKAGYDTNRDNFSGGIGFKAIY